jgi:hypothetical protein
MVAVDMKVLACAFWHRCSRLAVRASSPIASGFSVVLLVYDRDHVRFLVFKKGAASIHIPIDNEEIGIASCT